MTTELKVMVVEDEPLATRRLVKTLAGLPSVELVGIAENGRVALETIALVRPNVLLLDIEMPGLGGFELLEQLPATIAPVIVFVTAFDRYAARAFTIRAADFVLKPVVPERLRAALDHARVHLEARSAPQRLAALQQELGVLRKHLAEAESAYLRDLWVQRRSEVVRIPVAEIDWIEAEKDYVRIHSGAASYLQHGMIGALEEKLDPRDFIRVHRSAIVRSDRIRAVRRGRFGALDLELGEGTLVRVGRKYAPGVRRHYRATASPNS
jgi:two-component system LytT family response regulator